jgi:trans-2,3-dihydro-3-hydroxyanthranilate isomerase
MPDYPYTLCDVFAERPLAGNPLAVFTDGDAVPDPLRQPIARELNLSETVFVCSPAHGGDARLRIFTPRRELPFAGHPTLGAGAIIARLRQRTRLQLETIAGAIPVTIDGDLNSEREARFAWMRQPLPQRSTYDRPDALLAALGLDAALRPPAVYDNGIAHIYVAVDGPQRLAALTPDFSALASLCPDVGVACFARDGARWKVRMFAPGHGVHEDAATGSAAGPLAALLVDIGEITAGTQIELEQGTEIGRPSSLLVRTEGSERSITRIDVGGMAIPVGKGVLSL